MTARHWPHPCDECVLLGKFLSGETFAVLYWCPQSMLHSPTLVARYSPVPSDYASLPVRLALDELGGAPPEPFATALQLARRAGLVRP